jgi:hypothetical protein
MFIQTIQGNDMVFSHIYIYIFGASNLGLVILDKIFLLLPVRNLADGAVLSFNAQEIGDDCRLLRLWCCSFCRRCVSLLCQRRPAASSN